MKDRIKDVRKAQKLTQQEFAERLLLSKSTVEAIEYGRREATDRVINDICREFSINEEWLRFGTGEMYAPKTRAEEIAELAKKFIKDDSELRYQLVQLVAQMPDDMLAYFDEWLTNYVAERSSNLASYDSSEEQ